MSEEMELNSETKKPRRKKSSAQEKYDFLVSMIGKSEEELEQAKMSSGLTYREVKTGCQKLYNKGQLDLSPEQLDFLQQNGILGLSKEEASEKENKTRDSEKRCKKNKK